jgi:Fe-S-cluster-containing dehydrogenase component
MGCHACTVSCKAEKEVAEKCDRCEQRNEVGLKPAFVTSCPSEALQFGDFDDPATKTAREAGSNGWKEEAVAKPSVLYLGHRPWMEEKANTRVQFSKDDADVIYEQNNLKGGAKA